MWARIGLVVLSLLFVAGIVLNGLVVLRLIARYHDQQMQICRLYVVLHSENVTVVIPPNCP